MRFILPLWLVLASAALAQTAPEIDFGAPMLDLKDQPVFEVGRDGKFTDEKLTLGSVAASVMMSTVDADKLLQPKEVYANLQLGARLQHAGAVKLTTAGDCKKAADCLTVADRDKLRDRIVKVYGGVVAYRAWLLLDPE